MKPQPVVTSVSAAADHSFSKRLVQRITVVEGRGVRGDAHFGRTVKHRSRVAQDPNQPNLRQVHLIHCELFDELARQGYAIDPGDLGENITTQGIDLLGLCVGARLCFSRGPTIELTGLRNPCAQIEQFREGLLAAVLDRDDEGNVVRKAGVMGVVVVGGEIQKGDTIVVELPEGPHAKLERV